MGETTIMYIFWVFAGYDKDHSAGGMGDFQGAYETMDEADDCRAQLLNDNYDWAMVIDIESIYKTGVYDEWY